MLDTNNVSTLLSVEEYLLPFDDENTKHFINDARVKSAEQRSNCRVRMLSKVLNKKIRKGGWVKYAIVQITGPNDHAVLVCTHILENYYPTFYIRKPYDRKAVVNLCITEDVPDNLNYSLSTQRSSNSDECFHNIFINSFYSMNNRTLYPNLKPWKVGRGDKAGYFVPKMSRIYNSQSHVMPELIQFRQPVEKHVIGKLANSQLINDGYSSNSYVKFRTFQSKSLENLSSFGKEISEEKSYISPERSNISSAKIKISPDRSNLSSLKTTLPDQSKSVS